MKLVLFLIFISSYSVAQTNKSQEEKEQEIIDYSNIKNVLKNDGLADKPAKAKKLVSEIKQKRKEVNLKRYQYPDKDDFWFLSTQYYFVKKAQELRWEFPKPEYGIGVAFKQLLEKFGYYNKTFKVLIVNTPNIAHFGLPGGKDHYFFILSLPFMRSLDLTKVDIALLLLEDFFRIDAGYFEKNLKLDLSFIGTNFHEKKIDPKLMDKIIAGYDKVIMKTGFNFQQQYEITKKMDAQLKSEPELWSVYFKLYGKLERFMKSDLLYKNYLKIYPSPELQINWLSPKKKVI